MSVYVNENVFYREITTYNRMLTDWDGQKKIGKQRQHKLGKYDGERVIKIDGKFYPVEGYDHSIKRITYVMPVVSFMGEMVVLK